MALTYSTQDELGSEAPAFSLPGVDGKTYTLNDFEDRKALVVIFMCNHCPYVKAVQKRINDLAMAYGSKGAAVVGINSNDAERYPADSFEAMQEEAKVNRYVFPYLYDESQQVAKAYGAVCTPDPYVYEKTEGGFILRYHGRIDDNWKEPGKVTRRDLAMAVEGILKGTEVSPEQTPAMGCSIKWKPE